MNDKKVIIAGLAIFLAAVTFPFWYTVMAGAKVERPELAKPIGEKRCIEDKTFMMGNHMQILNEWRTMRVRDGIMEYTSMSYGVKYEISLTKTCLKCHKERDKFCNRCHNYVKADPSCWDCHNDPKGIN